MKVLVLGGYGLIGSGVVTALLSAGHEVTGLGRSVAAARRRWPAATWVSGDMSDLTTPESWSGIVAGMDAVVNCAGVLQDSPRDDIRKIQRDALIALFAACESTGVTRFVQISAVGARPGAPTLFMSTKGEADVALQGSTLDWTILRPALVIAPTAYGATALLRALAAFPFAIPLASADAPVRTVDVHDVATAVATCLAGLMPSRRSYDLAETEPHSLGEIVRSLRDWLGYPPAPVLAVPDWLAGTAFRLGDLLGWLGWRTPMRTTAFRELSAGIDGDPGPWIEAGGTQPASLQHTLARLPSTVQERWYARVWLMKPLAVATLVAFWIVSGLIGLAAWTASNEVLRARDVDGRLAVVAVLAGVAVDLLLGVAVLVRPAHRAALVGMIAVTLGYLGFGTLVAPDLWLDPLGAFVKTIPAAVLALFLLAVSEER